MPHSTRSTPDTSSSSETRIPMTALRINQSTNEAPKTHTKIVAAPTICPKNVVPVLVSGTANRPHRPTTP